MVFVSRKAIRESRTPFCYNLIAFRSNASPGVTKYTFAFHNLLKRKE